MNNTKSIQIQLKPELIEGTEYTRSFCERVLPQEFGDGIYTDGDSYGGEVGIYHKTIGHLGGEVKTEIGMKRMINKIRKEVK